MGVCWIGSAMCVSVQSPLVVFSACCVASVRAMPNVFLFWRNARYSSDSHHGGTFPGMAFVRGEPFTNWE